MTLFYYWQRFLYKFKAKNRHDIHSPFVYDFIESVVNNSSGMHNNIAATFFADANLKQKQIAILERICVHYGISAIVLYDIEMILNTDSECVRLWIFENAKDVIWPLNTEDIVVVLHLYSYKDLLDNWHLKAKNAQVTLSINVFELGVLFFKPTFKVKQQFVLKY
ncbi:MAG: hypothetical protein IT256_06275 [Chitinophagaceae bacterium]|nr:hypothetical protein [Chitinophagaceae bacterium]